MTKKDLYRQLQDYNRDNVDVRITSDIRFNAGSETSIHFLTKSLAGFIMQQAGWIVNGEVETPKGVIDVLCWGNNGRLDYAIEVETSPEDGVMERYLEQYIYPTEIDELIVINCNAMPLNLSEAFEWLNEELPAEI